MRTSLGLALAARAEEFLTHLIGAPSLKRRNEWRYRTRGSLVCSLSGAKRGLFFDHEAGEGGDLVDLLARERGCSLADAAREARRWLGGPASAMASAPRPPSRREPIEEVEAENFDRAMAIWNESVSAKGTLVETYLARRGVRLPATEDIRFHPALMHSPTGRKRPAMVALMRDVRSNAPTGVHRTFLSDDGTSKTAETPKMTLGRMRGACIKLAPDDEVTMGLGVCEGIETALGAMMKEPTPPIWVLLSTSGLYEFPVLGGIECLTIYTDHDTNAAGVAAALVCAKRWQAGGREAIIDAPERGKDWADVAKENMAKENCQPTDETGAGA